MYCCCAINFSANYAKIFKYSLYHCVRDIYNKYNCVIIFAMRTNDCAGFRQKPVFNVQFASEIEQSVSDL